MSILPPKKPSKRRRWIFWVSLCVLALVAAGAGIYRNLDSVMDTFPMTMLPKPAPAKTADSTLIKQVSVTPGTQTIGTSQYSNDLVEGIGKSQKDSGQKFADYYEQMSSDIAEMKKGLDAQLLNHEQRLVAQEKKIFELQTVESEQVQARLNEAMKPVWARMDELEKTLKVNLGF